VGVNLMMSAGQGLTAGVWTWVLFSLDFAAGTASVWFNDTAKILGAFPGSGAVGGVFHFADTSPLFYAARPLQQLDAGLNVLKGGFGPLLLFPGAIDWSVAAHRRTLFDPAGLPVVRAPFSPVAGVTPHFDTSRGLAGSCGVVRTLPTRTPCWFRRGGHGRCWRRRHEPLWGNW
jgi:hypothetical protein